MFLAIIIAIVYVFFFYFIIFLFIKTLRDNWITADFSVQHIVQQITEHGRFYLEFNELYVVHREQFSGNTIVWDRRSMKEVTVSQHLLSLKLKIGV